MKKFLPLLKIQIRNEQDIVTARHRTRMIAAFFGFENQDQTRIATAVSELVRNCYQYGNGGVVEYSFALNERPQILEIRVADKGPGIAELSQITAGTYDSPTGMGVGLMGAKKLMDSFRVETSREGTIVTVCKELRETRVFQSADLAQLSATMLKENMAHTPFAEIERQNRELVETLDLVHERNEKLDQLNQELADTNRGVLALYAELDEKAAILQKANEIKTGFLSNMTHEFRTPLTSIISLTRLLLDRVDGELSFEQDKQVRYVRQSAEGLLEIVNDLLDLAKVEAGKIAIKPAEFEVENLFSALRGLFKPLLTNEELVELVFENPGDVPPLVTDEAKLSQILRNLVSNALKFTEQGRVVVSARPSIDGTILFSVQDTGIGIAREDIERIFEDFSQVESKLQKHAKGTGLGLPLSRKLARLLGGDMWVESRIGRGSTFFARVPRIFQGSSEGSIVGEDSAVMTGAVAPEPLILMVDDDEASRYILRNMVRSHVTARFEEARTGQEGLAQAKLLRPALIFLDLAMPGLTGYEVLRALKADAELAEIPVIINSAKILTPDEADVLAQLSTGILSKERSDEEKAQRELRDALVASGFELIPRGKGSRAAHV